MSRQKAYVGKIVAIQGGGRVKVLSCVSNSRTLLNVLNINRGKGFDRTKGAYVGVKSTGLDKDGNRVSNWSRGEDRSFGTEDTIHLNKIIEDEQAS